MKRKTFAGGLHPPDNKEGSAHKAIESCPLPEEVVISLFQHVGAPAEACVAKGARVLKGQVVGEAKGFISVPVHASTSGEVIAVEPRLHPSGRALPAVVIRPDGEDLWLDGLPAAEPDNPDPDQIRDRVRRAGIVGLGGAAFPTPVKLTPPPEKTITTLILNGAECEPYLTADHRLMIEQTQRIVDGLVILQRALGARKALIGIESNKPDAIEAMRREGGERAVEVVPLAVKYPQGSEKQLIYSLTRKEVPTGSLPMDIGIVVQNVGTAAAVSDAVRRGIPLVERVVTVTGPALREPKNLRVLIGTPLSHLVACCGGLTEDPAKIVMGGPMMGTAQISLDVPVLRGTSGVVLFGKKDVPLSPEGPCIRCGRCVSVCPARIMPTTIAAYSRLGMMDEAEHFHAMDCIECGCCTYTCPSAIPLVQSVRHAKAAIFDRKRKL